MMRLRYAMLGLAALAIGMSLGSHINPELASAPPGVIDRFMPAEIVVNSPADCGDRDTPEASKASAALSKASLLFDLRGVSASMFMIGIGSEVYADRVLVWRDPRVTGALPVLAYSGGCAVAGAKVPIGQAIEVVRIIST